MTGRLRFDPAGGGTRLSLVGRFKNATEDGGEPIVRILGWIESKPVTLERCFATASNHRSPGVIESSYYANYALVGHHTDADQQFQSAEATFHHADTWINRSGIQEQFNYENRENERSALYSATFTPLDREVHEFSRGRIELGYCWQAAGNPISGVSMKQWPVFTLKYDEPRPLGEIQEDVRLLQNLMTLCVDATVDLDKLALRHPEIHATMLDGSDGGYEQPIELIVSPIPYTPPEKRKARHTLTCC